MIEKLKRIFYTQYNSIDLGNNIIFPKNILSHRTSNGISIEDIRNSRLNNPSIPEMELMKDLINLEIIPELPLLIRKNRTGWIKFCDRNGIPMNSPERYRLFHQVDLVIPKASVGIELDSIFHTGRGIEDMIRDKYLLLEYGLKILRFDGLDYKNHIPDILREINNGTVFQYPDYKEFSDDYFDKYYSPLVDGFTELFIYTNDVINPKLQGIILTNNDLRELGWDPSYIPALNEWLTEYINKTANWINLDIDKDQLIQSYKLKKRKNKIYYLLKQLGYL